MKVFLADYRVLHNKINDLLQLCRQIELAIYELAEVTADLDIFWSGEANDAFIAGVNEDLTRARESIEKVIQTVQLAGKALDEYQENEKVVNKILGGMKL